jgi:hypothetical protein
VSVVFRLNACFIVSVVFRLNAFVVSFVFRFNAVLVKLALFCEAALQGKSKRVERHTAAPDGQYGSLMWIVRPPPSVPRLPATAPVASYGRPKDTSVAGFAR